jgi:GxxExxY protein
MNNAEKVAQAARAVFKELGYGHSERVYHNALEVELSHEGVPFSSEGSVPVYYRGKSVGYRKPDLFVGEDEDSITVVELKARANKGKDQLRSYVKLGESDSNIEIERAVLVNFTADGVNTYTLPDDEQPVEGVDICCRCGERISGGRHEDCPEWQS